MPRLLAGVQSRPGPLLREAHLDAHGPLHILGASGWGKHPLFDFVDQACLRGRGGAAFPTSRKLEAVAASRRKKVVVANGVEAEPLSGKDQVLLGHTPHLVLDGILLAACALGADTAFVCVNEARPSAARGVERAISERKSTISDRVELILVRVPNRFVAGEESALVHFLNSGVALPTFTPPRPFERGVWGRPTLVSNVETFAHMALIARHGPEWFKEVGVRSEPGSMLLHLSGAVTRPGVYEVPTGTLLQEVVHLAGGLTAPVEAFLVGGYLGTWMARRPALATPLSHDDLSDRGGSLGAGVIMALPTDRCGLVETASISTYLAAQSAKQCGPCENGLGAIAAVLRALAAGHARQGAEAQVADWMGQIRGRGACHHPDGAMGLVRSGMELFEAEIANHRRFGPCKGQRQGVVALPVGSER